jgi:DNA topoisomerase-1
MFKKSGKGRMKPFCVNEKCAKFLPEDQRGYYKKKTAAEGTEGEPAGEPAQAEKKTAQKTAAKKPTAKKTAAKKTTTRKKKEEAGK